MTDPAPPSTDAPDAQAIFLRVTDHVERAVAMGAHELGVLSGPSCAEAAICSALGCFAAFYRAAMPAVTDAMILARAEEILARDLETLRDLLERRRRETVQ